MDSSKQHQETQPQPNQSQTTLLSYENNPFYIGWQGFMRTLQSAKSVIIYAAIVCAIGGILSLAQDTYDLYTNLSPDTIQTDLSPRAGEVPISDIRPTDTAENKLDTGVIFLAALGILLVAGLIHTAVYSLIRIPVDYAAAETSKGRLDITIGESFREALKLYPAYYLTTLISMLKIFAWGLLFVIPGVIAANKYRLYGIVFFAENKRGNAAITRSAELTKGAVTTTIGTAALYYVIGIFGTFSFVFHAGVTSRLYSQFAAAHAQNINKPNPHWLSVMMTALMLGVIVLVLILFAIILPFIIISSLVALS